MSHELEPKVGRWYRRLEDEELFKVVSIDEDEDLIGIKTVEGNPEKLDSGAWVELDLEYAEPPEDYIDPDDEDTEDEDLDDEDEERPGRRKAGRSIRDDWDDDDEDDEDWDDDDDRDDYDS